MDRAHIAPHRVNLYGTQQDKSDGINCRVRELVPYPSCGFDYYRIDGVMYAGYVDEKHPGVDACVILSKPMFERAAA